MNFEGRVAVVTGASQGIGRAIGRAFVSQGAQVAICGRNAGNLEETARELGPGVFNDVCDVTREDDVRRFVTKVSERFGRIDVLVNNAGDTSTALLGEMDTAFWERILRANLTSVYFATREVVPIMARNSYGRVVNIASMAAKRGSRYLSAYSAAKHGVLGFTESVALETVSMGILMNVVCPGYVDTPSQETNIRKLMQSRGLGREEVRDMMAQKNARRRFVFMEEVAETVLTLSDKSLAITGQAVDLW